MKGSAKRVSFSSPRTKSSASPKGSDENNRSNHEMSLNLQNPKKQNAKNFVSPTVSPASKATFPRKKILADRNEFLGSNSTNTHLSNNPNLDSKPSPKNIPKPSSKNSPPPQKTPLSYNSRDDTPSPGPYDPLTNYLSPRPQFLRYNPSRRKEIFSRLEMEEDKEDDDDQLSVCSSSGSASFDSKEGDNSSLASSSLLEDEESGDETLLELEDEVSDIESEEEAEEEVGWSLKGVFQYLLILVVLVLTTSYITSMNSPISAPAFQQGLIFGQNQSYGIVEVGGCKFFDGKREKLGLLGLNQAFVDVGIEEEMTNNVNMGETVSLEFEDRNGEFIEMVEELKRDKESEDVFEESGEATDQLAHEDVELQEKQTVESIEEVDEAEGLIDELVKTVKASDQHVEDIELQKREESEEQIEDVKENGDCQDETEEEFVKTGEVSDKFVEDIEREKGEQCEEQIEDLKENGEGQDGTEEELVKGGQVSDHLVEDIELQKGEESGEQIENVNEVIEDELVTKGEVSDHMVGNIEQLGQETAEHIEFLQGDTISIEIPVSVLERRGKDVAISLHNPKVMFGVFTCAAAIVVSVVLGSNIRRKGIASKHSSQVDKQSTKSVVEEKPSLVLPAEREAQRVHFNSLLNTAPLNIRSVDKDIEETYQIRAPSVQLLGEFEAGGKNSSFKTCAIQSRMKDIVSSYSDIREKDFVGVKAYSTPVQHHHQHDFSDIPTTNTSSSEGWTSANKNLLRKEFGSNDMATPTPLRRSARLQNRSFASP